MKIFIICCLLFIHVNMCIFIRGFRVSIRVSGIRGFGFGDGFPPESVSGSGSGFDFGFRFWVHGDSTRSEPDPLPFLPITNQTNAAHFENQSNKPILAQTISRVIWNRAWEFYQNDDRKAYVIHLNLESVVCPRSAARLNWLLQIKQQARIDRQFVGYR